MAQWYKVYWRSSTGEKKTTLSKNPNRLQREVMDRGGRVYKIVQPYASRRKHPKAKIGVDREKIIGERSEVAKGHPLYIKESWRDQPEEVEPDTAPYDYLVQHSKGKARQRLIQAGRVPGAKGKYAASIVASRLAHRRLTPEQKEEFGFRYTDWESIPASERGKYYGGSRHLKSLPKEKQRELGKEYYEQETKDGLGDFDITEFGTKMAGEDLSTIYSGSKKVWKEKEYEYMWQKLSTPSSKLKDIYFSKLSDPVKWFTSASFMAADLTLLPVTLGQSAVKLFTGKGDPFQRLQTGKTLILPDVGKSLARHRAGSPLGFGSVLISEGMGALTGKGSDEWERFQKHPISGAFATLGEAVGYLTGTTALKMGVGGPLKYGLKSTIKSMPKLHAKYVSFTGKETPILKQIKIYKEYRADVRLAKGMKFDTTTPLHGKLPSYIGRLPYGSSRYVTTMQQLKGGFGRDLLNAGEWGRYYSTFTPPKLLSKQLASMGWKIKDVKVSYADLTGRGIRNIKYMKGMKDNLFKTYTSKIDLRSDLHLEKTYWVKGGKADIDFRMLGKTAPPIETGKMPSAFRISKISPYGLETGVYPKEFLTSSHGKVTIGMQRFRSNLHFKSNEISTMTKGSSVDSGVSSLKSISIQKYTSIRDFKPQFKSSMDHGRFDLKTLEWLEEGTHHVRPDVISGFGKLTGKLSIRGFKIDALSPSLLSLSGMGMLQSSRTHQDTKSIQQTLSLSGTGIKTLTNTASVSATKQLQVQKQQQMHKFKEKNVDMKLPPISFPSAGGGGGRPPDPIDFTPKIRLPLLFSDSELRTPKKKKKDVLFDLGYREREWKVGKTESLLNVGSLEKEMKKLMGKPTKGLMKGFNLKL